MGQFDSLQEGYWYEIPNSDVDSVKYDWPGGQVPTKNGVGFPGIMSAWNGGIVDTNGNRFILWGGGHWAYGGNEQYAFDFDTLQWSRLTTPASYAICDLWWNSQGQYHALGYYDDYTPVSRHTYNHLVFNPTWNAMVSVATQADYTGGTLYPNSFVDVYNYDTSSWTRKADWPEDQRVAATINPNNNNIWAYQIGTSRKLYEYDVGTDSWTQRSARMHHGGYKFGSLIHLEVDPVNELLVLSDIRDTTYIVFDISAAAIAGDPDNYAPILYYWSDLFQPGSSPDPMPTGDFSLERQTNFIYHTTLGKMVAWLGGTDVVTCDPTTHLFIKEEANPANTVVPTDPTAAGVWGRWRYVPSENVMMVVNDVAENIFVYRIPTGQDDTNLVVGDEGRVYRDESATIYAEYKDVATGLHIPGATCTINIISQDQPMVENVITERYEYITTYDNPGIYAYTVTALKFGYDTQIETGEYIVKSDPIADGIIRVGPTREYQTCGEITPTLPDDSIVEIDYYDYPGDVNLWAADNVTIRGTGAGRPHIDADGSHYGGKGTWVISGDNYVVENLEFSNAAVGDRNGAGIRLEGIDIEVRNCYFHNNENGIQGGHVDSTILVEYCEFANNGYGGGQTHNIYIGKCLHFTFQFNYSHHANIGHCVKVRSAESYILYNRLMDETTGDSSYLVDIPDGGLAYVIGNLIHQGVNADNGRMVRYGEEHSGIYPIDELYVSGNTLVNERAVAYFFDATSLTSTFVNNLLVGHGAETVILGTGTLTNNIHTGSSSAAFVDIDNYDYNLTSGSVAIDVGVDPGSARGYSLTPAYQYVHPISREVRTTS